MKQTLLLEFIDVKPSIDVAFKNLRSKEQNLQAPETAPLEHANADQLSVKSVLERIEELGNWIREHTYGDAGVRRLQTGSYEETIAALMILTQEYYSLSPSQDYIFERPSHGQIEIGIDNFVKMLFNVAANGWSLKNTIEEWVIKEPRTQWDARLKETEIQEENREQSGTIETPLPVDTQIDQALPAESPPPSAAAEKAPDVKQFPSIDESDPNKSIWDEVESGNFDRNSIIERYKSLGETAEIENDRGLIDSHRRRAANLAQFFTPAPIVEFVTKLLRLDSTNLNPIILDNSCGIGGMFRYLSQTCRIAGIELEEKAYHMAKALYPDANIINDDLINHAELDSRVDFCLINPPFSIQIEKKNMKLENAGWGALGPNSSIQSHIAAIEIAIRAARGYVAAVVPTSFFENESTLTFERWIKGRAAKLMRIDLPAEAFKEYGTEWQCSIVVYKAGRYFRKENNCNHLKINSLSELDNAVATWRLSKHEAELNEFFEYDLKHPLSDLVLNKYEENIDPAIGFKPLPIVEKDCARIVLSRDASCVRFKPNGLLAALKIQELMDDLGEAYNNATKTNVSEFRMYVRRYNIVENAERIYDLRKKAEMLGIETTIDSQLINWLRNKQKWLKRQMTPFEQWVYQENMEQAMKNLSEGDVLIAVNSVNDNTMNVIAGREYVVGKTYRDALEIKDDSGETHLLEYLDTSNFILKGYEPDTWVELNSGSGMRTVYSDLYKHRAKQLDKLGIDWLYPFARDDVIRMSMKNSNLLADWMGLGKTRKIIALGLLYGCKHNLLVVEARLKELLITEFKKIKITDYKIIENENDLKYLKNFNIISYNKLWRPMNDRTKKTFGKALRRRCGFIAIDEGHGIKAKDSKQALAVRNLKARYKLISTGTPIANYPRNIFSLLVWGWGDGTELNKYGYYTPISDGYRYTSGTRRFKEDFITITWVSPQFEQTLDTGKKAREMPKIKDIKAWHAMLAPKMTRRVWDEPEVRKCIKIPEAKIEELITKPDAAQIAHYKKWLDNFAAWFREQLEKEKEGGHKIDQMIILAHLMKLQFASTIPQSPTTNCPGFEWTGSLTTKQAKTLEIMKEALANNEKIIVYSERPEFQKFMQEELKKQGIASHIFIGEQGIEDRNDLLDDFKLNGTGVLLATTTCGGTGLNIPEANVVVIADTSWTPSRQIQAYSRILRPQQKKQPRIFLLRCDGTIDMYMRQLMNAKNDAINQGIDHSAYQEIDMSKWLSYRDFTIKMLKDEGYDI